MEEGKFKHFISWWDLCDSWIPTQHLLVLLTNTFCPNFFPQKKYKKTFRGEEDKTCPHKNESSLKTWDRWSNTKSVKSLPLKLVKARESNQFPPRHWHGCNVYSHQCASFSLHLHKVQLQYHTQPPPTLYTELLTVLVKKRVYVEIYSSKRKKSLKKKNHKKKTKQNVYIA